jgi:hypothetical protein
MTSRATNRRGKSVLRHEFAAGVYFTYDEDGVPFLYVRVAKFAQTDLACEDGVEVNGNYAARSITCRPTRVAVHDARAGEQVSIEYRFYQAGIQ